jgi:hypothetical protein
MPTKKTVTVNREGDTLILDPALVELESGDWVEWNFLGDLSGNLPIIEFSESPPGELSESPFGPFYCLESKPDATVQGKGNGGEQRDYSYTALLLDSTEAPATSGEGVVRNLQQPDNTSPVLVVGVRKGEGEGELFLDVPSEPLMLFPGDTALWHVSGLPSETFISFLFHPASSHADLDPLVGPFKSLLAHRVQGEEPGVMRVIGVTFTPMEGQAAYTYQIAVRNSEGAVQVSHDPTIDNLGPPVPPVSEVS